jgi:hypothetical protein
VRRPAYGLALAAALLAAPAGSAEWRPPEVATSRQAFEAAHPKTSVSAAALELEALSTRLGIDLAPKDDHREHPDLATARAQESALSALSQYLNHELGEASEKIGAPDPKVAQFLAENDATIESIRAVTLGRREVAWELDVSLGHEAPMPNFLGHLKIQKVLGALALTQSRARDFDAALQTAEAMWRLCESLASRPELLSQLIGLAEARFLVGLLRKIDAPAFEWVDRFRRHVLYDAFLVAFQNDPWPSATDPELEATVGGITRIYRRFVDSLSTDSACDWTLERLKRDWEVAASGENGVEGMLAGIASENLIEMLMRWQRFRLDSELTALVLEARGEKAASREGEWPARLPNLESGVCPGQSFSYRRVGGVVLDFSGHPPPTEPKSLVLPLTFRGEPPPTPTPTPSPTATRPPAVLTPTPTPHRLSPP